MFYKHNSYMLLSLLKHQVNIFL